MLQAQDVHAGCRVRFHARFVEADLRRHVRFIHRAARQVGQRERHRFGRLCVELHREAAVGGVRVDVRFEGLDCGEPCRVRGCASFG